MSALWTNSHITMFFASSNGLICQSIPHAGLFVQCYTRTNELTNPHSFHLPRANFFFTTNTESSVYLWHFKRTSPRKGVTWLKEEGKINPVMKATTRQSGYNNNNLHRSAVNWNILIFTGLAKIKPNQTLLRQLLYS